MKRPYDVKLSCEAGEAFIERLEGNALTAEEPMPMGAPSVPSAAMRSWPQEIAV